MANPKSKKRRKIVIFTAIGLVLVGLTVAAVFRKREPVITVQVEKSARRNLTETVVANGKIQPVLQVKISPEVSGEIIDLPVKEGQAVKKGDLLVKINPDVYISNRKSAEASYMSASASRDLAEANMKKAELEFKRNEELLRAKLVSESTFLEFKTGFDVAKAQYQSAIHQVDVANASLSRTVEELAKTTIVSPLNGTISKLNSRLGERVVGTSMMAGTEIMIVADLNEMEARVDLGEIDVVLIKPGQKAKLEVDAFRDRKFDGTVTEIANSSNDSGLSAASGGGGGSSQEATKFQVKIHVNEKENFRPGMSVTSEIETRYRTNVLSVPIQSVTTRLPKEPASKGRTNGVVLAGNTAGSAMAADASSASGSSTNKTEKKASEAPKPIEVVFVVEGDHVKMVPVKRGISDDSHVEIIEGLKEGEEVVSGGYKAISRELEDGKKVGKGKVEAEKD
ncbi:MAG TPA: efflux RND transporter periplasmic adaptor subunit, partial [Candidatus Angelobacter sp.]|nr:efflux RND transporter periplasmic adaptor subunit [Candidatus Angelobacter sp.]